VHPLLPQDGVLPVVRPEVDAAALDRLRATPEREVAWAARVAEIEALPGSMGQDRES
jgi:O-succinylbenzoate synthase